MAQARFLFYLTTPPNPRVAATFSGYQSNHKMLWAGGLSYFLRPTLSSAAESFFSATKFI